MRLATVLVAAGLAALACLAGAEGADRRARRPMGKEIKPGDMAPDFELVLLADDVETAEAAKDGPAAPKAESAHDGAARRRGEEARGPERVRLSSFRGKSPVLLMFSSYT
jgi:hypothetical protein